MKPTTPRFPKGSLSAAAHRTYLGHVRHCFLFALGPSFYKNRFLFGEVWHGIKAVFGLLILLLIMIVSPLFSWYAGYRAMKKARQAFEHNGGTYAGKFDHLNRYKDEQ